MAKSRRTSRSSSNSMTLTPDGGAPSGQPATSSRKRTCARPCRRSPYAGAGSIKAKGSRGTFHPRGFAVGGRCFPGGTGAVALGAGSAQRFRGRAPAGGDDRRHWQTGPGSGAVAPAIRLWSLRSGSPAPRGEKGGKVATTVLCGHSPTPLRPHPKDRIPALQLAAFAYWTGLRRSGHGRQGVDSSAIEITAP